MQLVTNPTCEVCEVRESVVVAAVPGVPYSAAYCRKCLHSGAIPYWIAVTNTAMVDGWDNAAEWWKEVVDATLIYLEVSTDRFKIDVEADIAEFERYCNGDKHYSQHGDEAAVLDGMAAE